MLTAAAFADVHPQRHGQGAGRQPRPQHALAAGARPHRAPVDATGRDRRVRARSFRAVTSGRDGCTR